MIKITNISTDRRPVLVQLDHQTFRRSVYGFRRQAVMVNVVTKDGQSSVREESRAIDGVLTLGWKESKEMHADIAACPSVQELVRAGRVRLEPVEPKVVTNEPPTRKRRSSNESQG